MKNFYLRLHNVDGGRATVRCGSLDDARVEAVRYLGAYLGDHPDFVGEHHWKLTVESSTGVPYLHVIIATVPDRNCPSNDE